MDRLYDIFIELNRLRDDKKSIEDKIIKLKEEILVLHGWTIEDEHVENWLAPIRVYKREDIEIDDDVDKAMAFDSHHEWEYDNE